MDSLWELLARKARLVAPGLLTVGVFLGAILHANTASAGGKEIYKYILGQEALASYMGDFVSGVSRDLTDGSSQVNRDYRPDRINIYIVDVDRLDASYLNGLGVPHIGEAVALERETIIIIDQDHLKELVTLSILFWELEWPMHQAMSELGIRGLSAMAGLWDPSSNRALLSDEVQHWRIAFRGALGFLLAHELGHIRMGQSGPAEIRTMYLFRNRRERDIHWACPELVDERAALHREIESRADNYAMRLLQTHSGGRSPGRYEVGAEWYFSVLLQKSYLEALGRIQNFEGKPELKIFLEDRYGRYRFAALLEKRRASTGSRKGPVSSFYPRTHPSAIARLSLSLGLDPTMTNLAEAWAQRMRRECARLQYQ